MEVLNLRQSVIIGALLLGMGAAHFCVFDRANARLDREMAAINTADQSRAVIRRAAIGLEKMDRQVSDLHAAVSQFETLVPDSQEAAQTLTDVSRMADACSLQFTTTTPIAVEDSAGAMFASRTAQITLSGDFNAFYSFLLQLEKRAGAVRIASIDLGRIDGKDGDISARVGLQLFSTRAAGAAGRVATISRDVSIRSVQ